MSSEPDRETINSIINQRFGATLPLIDPETRNQMAGIYLFKITISRQSHCWTLDVRDCRFYSGEPEAHPDVVYMMNAQDFLLLLTGKLNLSKAYLSKKIRLQGNVSFAFKLVNYFSLVDPNIELNVSNKVVVGGGDSNVQSQQDHIGHRHEREAILELIPADPLKSDVIFHFISDRLPSVSQEITKQGPFVIQFNILRNKTPSTIWTIDTKSSLASVYRAPAKDSSPDASLTVEDDAYVKLIFGQLNPQRAFMTGQIKVKGNILLLRRVDTLWNQIQKTRNDPELPFVKDLLLNSKLVEGFRSETVFFELIPRLLQEPDLLPPGKSIVIDITKNGSVGAKWLLRADPIGHIEQILHCPSTDIQAQLHLAIEDDDFVLLIRCPKLEADCHNILQFISGDKSLLSKFDNLLRPKLLAKL